MSVDVSYVFIGQMENKENVTGLNYSYSKTDSNSMLVSYIIILKIANNAPDAARVTNFRAYLAPQITVHDAFFTQPNGSPVPGPMGQPAVEVQNALITEARDGQVTGGWSNTWWSYTVRLVAITGITTLNNFDQQYLQNRTLDVYAGVNAEPAYTKGKSDNAYDYKRITFTYVDGNYLYNALLEENQTLVIDGLDAKITANRSS